jgi:hypothetical protein
MPDHIDWVAAALASAKAHGAEAPDSVWVEIEAFLRGKCSERQLPPKEQEKVARHLIEAITTKAPKTEELK